ncbi:MAG: hypothetical protein SF339_16955 [Blastocatellia bacterium]|nr:hypothetical protein [Blastocatellia bacterium]
MKTRTMLRSLVAALALTLLLQPALAGPPLICQTIEIGDAGSLPWGGSQWRDVKRDYDLNRLVDDTLALLQPNTPVLARMETLRRATVYAVWSKVDHEVGMPVKDHRIADELLTRLMDRTREAVRNNQSPALALFDAGYLISCYQQANYQPSAAAGGRLEGYSMVRKAAGFNVSPAEMQFALSLISRHPTRATHPEHLQKAVAGAADGSLLARNLLKHFGKPGQNLAALRSQVAVVKN